MASRRKAAPKPIKASELGKKPVKFSSVQTSGSRNQLVVQSAAGPSQQASSNQPDPIIEHLSHGLSELPELHFGADNDLPFTEQPTLEEPGDETYNINVDDDLEDLVMSGTTSKSGKGQNEMLGVWLTQHGDSYLRAMYAQYTPPPGSSCSCLGLGAPVFKCRDCLSPCFLCQECIVRAHAHNPGHRVREWVGNYFKPAFLKDLGHLLVLGNHVKPCPSGTVRKLLLGCMTGFHQINAVYCNCEQSSHCPTDYEQLLQARIFPCSTERPSSAFDFNVLRTFHIASAESKISGGRFYSLLCRLTNSTLPETITDRYREFMRTARAWMLLQTKKRAGSFQAQSNEPLSVRCPACPIQGVNYDSSDVSDDNRYLYRYHLSYDGSFQLVRRQRAQDAHDICLTDGLMYFVENASYEAHLAQVKDDVFMNTKISDCNEPLQQSS